LVSIKRNQSLSLKIIFKDGCKEKINEKVPLKKAYNRFGISSISPSPLFLDYMGKYRIDGE